MLTIGNYVAGVSAGVSCVPDRRFPCKKLELVSVLPDLYQRLNTKLDEGHSMRL